MRCARRARAADAGVVKLEAVSRKEPLLAASTVADLTSQIAQVRENPTVPYDVAKDMSLDDIGQAMAATRAALVGAIEAAPDAAFEAQPENSEGEEVWSVGQIVGHCNGSLVNIGGQALKAAGLDLGEPPEALVAAAEEKIMSREDALAAARVVNTDDFIALLSDDENLDKTMTHDFFGVMSGRSWLYFAAMHEAEHVSQIKSLG